MSQVRYCVLKDTHVIFEPKRRVKPFSFKVEEDITVRCPFCPENEDMIKIKIAEVGSCRVVANRFNALAIEEDPYSKREGFYEYVNGFGAHEVVIETPHHDKKMCDYSMNEFKDYFLIIANRFNDLKKDSRIKYIQFFKNSGVNAGASIAHEHSQILALSYIPKSVRLIIERNLDYKREHFRSIITDLIDEELRLNKRVVAVNAEYVAFCPYASLFPFEVIIAPLTDIDRFESLSGYSELSSIFRRVFRSLYATIGDFSFNMYLHNIEGGRFYFDITPRIYQVGGFELSTNMFINPVLPEEAAERLRENV